MASRARPRWLGRTSASASVAKVSPSRREQRRSRSRPPRATRLISRAERAASSSIVVDMLGDAGQLVERPQATRHGRARCRHDGRSPRPAGRSPGPRATWSAIEQDDRVGRDHRVAVDPSRWSARRSARRPGAARRSTSDRTPPPSSARRTTGARGRALDRTVDDVADRGGRAHGGRIPPTRRPATTPASSTAEPRVARTSTRSPSGTMIAPPAASMDPTRISSGPIGGGLAGPALAGGGQRDDRGELALDTDRRRHVALDADDADRLAVGPVDAATGRRR